MAEKEEKWPENKSGKYYVDQACIACDACVTVAPDHFVMDEDEGHAYVVKQPEGAEEEELCEEAMEGCPVEAIGDDG